ncbi:MAG TPA: hypothetical protein VKW06_09545 [Candidatus Angelobacter sp.]|nr:hypothetical protein [Candidatus Angelobacter sp.]
MTVMFSLKNAALLATLALNALSPASCAQDIPGLEPVNVADPAMPPAIAALTTPPAVQVVRPSITVAPGTHVLMVLTNPLHSTSGVEGSGVYLETLQPVIQNNQIVIPAHSLVQGVVEANKRPGHFHRTAEFRFRFTTLVFPNNQVAAINGVLLGLPGSRDLRMHHDDGKLKTVDQTEKVVVRTIVGATGGTLLGSISGLGVGKLGGGGLGAGFGAETGLLLRGDDIALSTGTQMEMMLQSPLLLEPEQAAFNAQYIPPLRPMPAQASWEARRKTVQRRSAGPWPAPGLVRWY